MFDDKDLGSEVLANPLSIQRLVINEIQQRLGGGTVIADPNSGFNILAEFASSVTAQCVRKMDRDLMRVYPRRAITSEDLYKHMSDFDYINMTSSPAQTKIQLAFDARYLRANAVDFNTAYKKVIIPVDTKFTIGTRSYGIYYPIEIRINSSTGNFIVSYDTTYNTPLFELTDNTLDYTISTINGIEWLFITMPIWQFNKIETVVTTLPSSGFNNTYSYSDKFYACRVYTTDSTKTYKEMGYTLSENIYSPLIPTAKIKLNPENSSLSIVIPQVYFTNDQIGNTVKIEIYTTAGELDEMFTETDLNTIKFVYPEHTVDPVVSKYSAILTRLPSLHVGGVEQKITGGSNGLSFEELRSRIITGSMYTDIPITPLQLTAFMNDQGFTIKRYIDNITNRIYYGYRTLKGGAIDTVLAAVPSTQFDMSIVNQVSTIKQHNNDSITILPSTIYRYTAGGDRAVPLTDTEVTELTTMTGEALVTQVNNVSYTKSPFHVVVYMEDNYPLSKTFNLSSPYIENIKFESENVNMVAQANIRNAIVTPLNDGAGGFRLRFGISKTPSMAALSETDTYVYGAFETKAGVGGYVRATFTNMYNGMHVYDLYFTTDYRITQDGYIRITNLTDTNGVVTVSDISLTSPCKLYFLVSKSTMPLVKQDYEISADVPAIASDLLAANKQSFTLVLGKDCSPIVFNKTTVIWNPVTYAKHDYRVYETYATDVYARDGEGNVIFQVVNGKVLLQKLHSAGDIVTRVDNEPIVKHEVGDYIRDSEGNLIPQEDRTSTYYVEMMHVDYRLFISQNSIDKTFVTKLSPSIASYLDTLDRAGDKLLEQTKLYFKPNRTLGTGQFITGNGKQITLDLGLSFGFKVSLTPGAMTNEATLNSIRASIVKVVDDHISKPIISITHIVEDIRAVVADYVISIDITGINNDIQLQTLVLIDEDNVPIVKVRMVKNDDGTISLEKAIDIEFVPIINE